MRSLIVIIYFILIYAQLFGQIVNPQKTIHINNNSKAKFRILFPQRHNANASDIQAELIPNENKIVTYGDNSPIIWDLRYGVALKKLIKHESSVQKVIIHENIYTSDGRDAIYVWNTNGDFIKEFKYDNGRGIMDFDLLKNHIVGGGFENTWVWDIKTKELIVAIPVGYDSWTKYVKLILGGNYLLTVKTNYSGSSILNSNGDWENHTTDSMLYLWNLNTGKVTAKMNLGKGPINKLEVDEKNKKAYVFSEYGEFKVFDYSNPNSTIDETPFDLQNFITISRSPYDLHYELDIESQKLFIIQGDTDGILIYDFKEKSFGLKNVDNPKELKILNGLLLNYDYDSALVYNVDNFEYLFKIDGFNRLINADKQFILFSDYNRHLNIYSRVTGALLKYLTIQNDFLAGTYFTNDSLLTCIHPYGIDRINTNTLKKDYLEEYVGTNNYPKQLFLPKRNIVIKSDLKGGNFEIIDLKTGQIKHQNDEILNRTKIIGFDASEKYLYGYSRDTIRIFELDSMKLYSNLIQDEGMNHFEGKPSHRMSDPLLTLKRICSAAAFSHDGKYFAISVNDSLIHFKSAFSNEIINTFYLPYAEELDMLCFLNDNYDLVCMQRSGIFMIINPFTGAIKYDVDIDDSWDGFNEFYELNDGRHVLAITDLNTAYIVNKLTGKIDKEIQTNCENAKFCQPDYLVSYQTNDTVKIWNIFSGRLMHEINTGLASINNCFIDTVRNRLIVVTDELLIKYFNLSDGKVILTSSSLDGNDIFSFTDKNYYYATKSAATNFFFENNKTIYSFDQFDLRFNRPDIVFKNFGNKDTLLISSYHQAFLKRLKKMHFTENMLSDDFHLPVLRINNKEEIPQQTDNRTLSINIIASDNTFKLDRINIHVNEVPVYGINGINLRDLNIDSISKAIDLTLASGNNKVQVSCLNERGVESLKETFVINYKPKVPFQPKTYFIGIGVQHYKDSTWNLTYSAKDIRDLADAFSNHSVIILDTLIDKRATKDSILKLKEKLLKTNVDDKVIISVSGHGLLDKKNSDFYFGTYDVDFEHPEKRGLLYDDLESLLDSIPARNKLLLLDACHSGEVDKEGTKIISDTLKSAQDNKLAENVKAIKGKRGVEVINTNSMRWQNSFELMQILFADISKGSGAVVISAAGGMEYAFEDKKWNNGVFTYSVLKCLEEKGTNKEGIKVSVLKDYVTEKVSSLTNGQQKPTSRKENLENNFKVW
ncbi:MAG: caspase family protein [Bacteroidia bacterium]